MKILKLNILYTSLICLFIIQTPCSYAVPVKEIFPSWYTTNIQGNALRLAYVSNHPIDNKNQTINRIIILIHGAGRSKITHDRVSRLAQNLGVANQTMIFQPQFLIEEDVTAFKLPDDVLFWDGGWRKGDLSHNGIDKPTYSGGISSFEIVNKIVKQLLANNPNAEKVVIAGHSAGGQYAQRFAAGSQLEQELAPKGINVRYVSANPSSYVYFDNKRVIPGTLDQFAVPNSTAQANCPDYNEYKFGLENVNKFMKAVGVTQILKQFPLRDVRYVYGADDNNAKHKSLGTSCGANLQGSQRLERGIIFYNHLKQHFGPDIQSRHLQAIIPDAGHKSTILTTKCGASFLLDIGGCNMATPGNLTASIQNNRTVQLEWIDHAEGETGYKVERSTDGGTTYQQIGAVNSNKRSFLDKTIKDSSSYHYRVRGYANNKNTGFSNIVRVNSARMISTQ